ncbi:23S rRNA pseudouridine(2605) synthase RluB [Microbulbifer pacificus]|uniref:23S rRNA pseudouridine(2605) synthase RluB n=1 Tax=Microbulbifer pacificus TaxID=407164 RepID=UPI001F18C814|nr:pseudouridine synthase [Microbulbifer pacificus]
MSQDAAPAGEKLQKVLARAGLGSRREMERAIEAGRVTVNGEVAGLGERVTDDDRVEFDGKRIAGGDENRLRVILYNKPIGEICSRHDPEGRPTVYDRLPRLGSGRWISVGRLDFNTSGLLLFTNSGELANKLMHPSSVIDREYLVRIQGQVDDEMKKRLVKGVQLDDGEARFTDIVESGGEGSNRWFYCVVMEGRNREVRRLWESQGVRVSRLKRVRYGSVFIPSHVRVGQWIEMEPREIDDLCITAGLPKLGQRPLTQAEKENLQRQRRKLRKAPAAAPLRAPAKPVAGGPAAGKSVAAKSTPGKKGPQKGGTPSKSGARNASGRSRQGPGSHK